MHQAARHALEHDGWTITHDPYRVEVGGVNMLIDLGAERLIAAEKADQKIAVEVKSFAGSSNLSEFHTALGQFLNYRLALAEYDPERRLYPTIPRDVYRSFFFTRFALAVQQAYPSTSS
jgi:hypothetical protein